MSPSEARSERRSPFMRADLMKGVARLRLGFAVAVVALVVMTIFGDTFVRGMAAGILAFSVIVFGGFAVVIRKKVRTAGRPPLEPPPMPLTRWDYSMAAHDLEGRPIAFSEFAGEVLVLNFWATWCAPCIREMPGLERLRDATADLDVRFACVTGEAADTVRTSLEKRSWSLPVYVLDGEAPECFRTRGIPATFILDRTGLVALRHVGAAAWDDEKVVTFVRGLAAAPAKGAPQQAVDP
jgi:thiol-disulfide isomerase/thioredoxin